jgi:trans-2,3-dihydro-3-hydroxyanthranilate isomerase
LPGQNARFYHVVDVFTERVLEGNALAVFPQGTEFADDVMQKIARELNLSETVFVLPSTRPDCAARLRIFTPFYELMFAGHPTVGTSFVLLAEGIVPPGTERFLLEEGVGPVPVRVESGARPLIWLTTPPIEYGPLFDRDAAAEALGLAVNELLDIPPQLVSAGNPFIFVALRNREAVDRAALDKTGMRKFNTQHLAASGVFVFAPTTEGAYSRMFAPDHGIIEDPATGSATGPLAAYMLRHNLVSGADGHRFISEQGTKMGRRSILHVRLEGQNGEHAIEVGGCVTPFASGVLT